MAIMLLRLIPLIASLLVTNISFTNAHPPPSNSLVTPTLFLNQPIATQTLLQRQISPSPTTPPASTNEYFITTKYITIEGFTNDYATKNPQTITIAIPTCLQTITPDQHGYLPPGTCGAMYQYYPSFTAAIVTAVLFGMLTVAHITLASIYKQKFCWVIIMGCLWETVAFAIRAASTRQQQNSSLVLVSQLFVLLVPLWINAYIYILLSHLIHYISPTHSILKIPASLLSLIFVILDFTSFVIQMIGGLSAGPTASQAEQMKGIHIYMGGIGLQQFFIVLFVGIAVKFQLEMRGLERMGIFERMGKRGWKRLLWAVYAGLGFITIRIVYRLIEFSGGHDRDQNPLPFREIYLYVLEVVPMFLAILTFVVVHPGRILVGPDADVPGVWRTLRGGRGKGKGWREVKGKIIDEEGVELVGS